MYLDQKAHVDKVVAAKDSRKLVYESVLEPHCGDAYLLQPGQIIRIEQREKQVQICDWMFVTPDLREESSYGNSAFFQGMYLYKYYQVMSNTNRMRPLVVMVADEAPDYFSPRSLVCALLALSLQSRVDSDVRPGKGGRDQQLSRELHAGPRSYPRHPGDRG